MTTICLASQMYGCALVPILRSPSRHGAKTWVTLWSQDMGDTFFIKQLVFCGYAVEEAICDWGAPTLDAGVAPEGKVGVLLVSSFRREPQDGLQVEAAFFAR